jgi:hypothetical protein
MESTPPQGSGRIDTFLIVDCQLPIAEWASIGNGKCIDPPGTGGGTDYDRTNRERT